MPKKISFFISSIFLLIAIPALASFNYQPMEKIPGFTTSGNFCNYIATVYNFGLWVIGICAMFMIIIGGYMYIMSAGNTASTGKAKGIITDAVMGLLLAFTAYLILHEINPDLVVIKGVCDKHIETSDDLTPAKPGTPVSSPECNQINTAVNNNAYGISPGILKAILAGGEGCNPSKSSDGHGSCGYSQALPAIRTACGITGTAEETCAKIQADTQTDVNCAAWLIKQQSGSCGTTDPVRVGCCYNGGPSNGDCHKNQKAGAVDYASKINNYISKYGNN